jgi:hypothetical protein
MYRAHHDAGGGKSLTFQLPALAKGNGFTVVIGPLMALAKDQVCIKKLTEDADAGTTCRSMLVACGLPRRAQWPIGVAY